MNETLLKCPILPTLIFDFIYADKPFLRDRKTCLQHFECDESCIIIIFHWDYGNILKLGYEETMLPSNEVDVMLYGNLVIFYICHSTMDSSVYYFIHFLSVVCLFIICFLRLSYRSSSIQSSFFIFIFFFLRKICTDSICLGFRFILHCNSSMTQLLFSNIFVNFCYF